MSGELPEGWARPRLQEIATAIQYGYTASADNGRAGPRFLRITDIQDGRVDWGSVPGCEIDSAGLERYRLELGDIVFARSGATTGKSFLIKDKPPDAVFASYLIRVRVNQQVVEPSYLARYFQSPVYWAFITDNLAGNAQPNCNGSKLAALPIELPPIAEQRRIASKVEALLAQVNAARERLEKVPRLLNRFRQAVLAKAFRGELVPTEAELAAREGRAFQTAAELLGRPSNARSDELPEGWAEAQFASLLREPLRNGHSAKASGTQTGVRTLTLSAVTYGEFTDGNTKLTVADPAKVSDLWLESGDILIERANTPELVGTARLYRGPKEWAIFPDLLIRARVSESLVLSEFAELFLQSETARRYFQSAAQGTAGSMPKIDQGAVERLTFVLPPLAEQSRIVAKVEALLAAAAKVEAEAERQTRRLERAPQAILQKAFSGELVPTEAELARIEGRTFESAAEMLARIGQAEAGAGQATARRGGGGAGEGGQAARGRRVARAPRLPLKQ